MRSYLIYSSSAHFLLLAVIFFFSRGAFHAKKTEAYYVDFIGPSSVVTMQKAGTAEAAPEAAKTEGIQRRAARAVKAAARPDEDDFSSGALPKPSVLAGGAKLVEEEKPEGAAGGESGAPMITDSNFPYPWYITQVREALWTAWTGKMPSGGSLRCTVQFSILRDGAVRSVSVERSSGNRLFDTAAESTVQGAAPFASLPDDFYEDRLTVHVEFKAMD